MKSTEFIMEWNPIQRARQEKAEQFNANEQKFIQIGKKCKPYLSQVQDPFNLYRGVSGTDDAIIKKRIRLDNREPLGMAPTMQTMVNKYFNEKFGAPFRFSALCTGEEWVAEGFGDVYAIFPIGDFKFLWANDVEDLNEHIWSFEESFGDYVGYSDITQFLNDKDYRTDDINSAIASGKEIMLRAAGYYGIHKNYINGNETQIQKLLEIGMEQ